MALGAACIPATLAPTHVYAEAQTPAQRIAEGSVVGKDNAPIKEAIVYLKDTKSLAIKSYISDEAGHFRFGPLAQSADYEIWAEISSTKKRSKTRNISSFDSRNNFNFKLVIDTDK